MRKLIVVLLGALLVIPFLPVNAQDDDNLTTLMKLLQDNQAALIANAGVEVNSEALTILQQDLDFNGQQFSVIVTTTETSTGFWSNTDEDGLVVAFQIEQSEVNTAPDGETEATFSGFVLAVDENVVIYTEAADGFNDLPIGEPLLVEDTDAVSIGFTTFTLDDLLDAELPFFTSDAIRAVGFASTVERFDNEDGSFSFAATLDSEALGTFLQDSIEQDLTAGEEVTPGQFALAIAAAESPESTVSYFYDFDADGQLISGALNGVILAVDLDYHELVPESFQEGTTGTIRLEDGGTFVIVGRDLTETSIDLPETDAEAETE